MQQKEISRWLKAITIVLALMGAVFFLYIMPVLAMSWRDADESLAYLFMPAHFLPQRNNLRSSSVKTV